MMGLILKAIFGLAIVQGVFGNDCKWQGWQDNDNPSGYGDSEYAPVGCYVQKYEIQLASGTGPIYTDYTTVPNDIMNFNPWYYRPFTSSSQGFINCKNREQPEPACANFNFTNTWGPVCCSDYRVDFCCLPEPPCQDSDNRCINAFDGLGECVDITVPNLQRLQQDYDLTVPALKGLCNSTIDDTCCSCMKKKTCSDTGCSSQFGGQGVCVNMVSGGVANHNLDLSVEPDNSPNLCSNTVNQDCCSCFKSANGGTETGPPCEDIKDAKYCEKVKKKGKCKKAAGPWKKCKKTCDRCDDRTLAFDPFY